MALGLLRGGICCVRNRLGVLDDGCYLIAHRKLGLHALWCLAQSLVPSRRGNGSLLSVFSQTLKGERRLARSEPWHWSHFIQRNWQQCLSSTGPIWMADATGPIWMADATISLLTYRTFGGDYYLAGWYISQALG